MGEREPRGRIRIRTFRHKEHVADDDRHPFTHGLLPSFEDVHIVYVNPEGKEEEIAGVMGIEWSARPNEVCTARLTIQGAELDADAEVAGSFAMKGLGNLERRPPRSASEIVAIAGALDVGRVSARDDASGHLQVVFERTDLISFDGLSKIARALVPVSLEVLSYYYDPLTSQGVVKIVAEVPAMPVLTRPRPFPIDVAAAFVEKGDSIFMGGDEPPVASDDPHPVSFDVLARWRRGEHDDKVLKGGANAERRTTLSQGYDLARGTFTNRRVRIIDGDVWIRHVVGLRFEMLHALANQAGGDARIEFRDRTEDDYRETYAVLVRTWDAE